ncbi:MAG: heparinase II/III domain-containing protein, partial [Pyrinomonadaceae bacterium]
PWIVHYLDAHAHATGEDLWDHPGLRQMHKYVAHSTLPSGQYVFDFGDIFEGPLTRAGRGEEHKRTHPGGRFHTNYNILYRVASRFRDAEAQGVAAWLAGFNQVNAEDYWSLLWYDPRLPATPMEKQQPWHYFADHGVVYWRDGWTPAATAFAFKAGPPEGHHTTALLARFPDWHLSSGHAHPDANSFIIYARGKYLTGDTGYAGLPMTEQHNTVLIDGRGQAREGGGHDAFRDVPYERLDRIRIAEAQLGPRFAYVRGEAAAAYEPELGVTRFDRHLLFTAPDGFVVWDDLETREPRLFTTLLHADQSVEQRGRYQYAIEAGGARLLATIVTPEEVRGVVEPNVVTAAGRPGAVDKGERQERGKRLAVSTTVPATAARFVMLLSVEKSGRANDTRTATESGDNNLEK